jgi:hypothetical protein
MTVLYAEVCLAGSVFFFGGGGFFSPFRIIYLHIVRQMTKYDTPCPEKYVSILQVFKPPLRVFGVLSLLITFLLARNLKKRKKKLKQSAHQL